MNNITVYLDTSELRKLQEVLQGREKALKNSIRRTMKDTIKAVRTKATRHARHRYTYFDAARLTVREKIVVDSGDTFSAEVLFSGRRGVSLRHFRPSPAQAPDWRGVAPNKRKPKKGVSSVILRGMKRKLYTGPDGEKPFWARAKQGHMALFYREASKKHDGKHRLHMLFGPSPIQALGESAAGMLEDTANTTLKKSMQRALRAAMLGYQK